MILIGYTHDPLSFVLGYEHKHISANTCQNTFILGKLSKDKKTDVGRKAPIKAT